MSAAPILLRARSGSAVGIGHVVRTRALAQELQRRGLEHELVVDDDASVRWLAEHCVHARRDDGDLREAGAVWLDGFVRWERELEHYGASATPIVLVENRLAQRERAAAVVYPALHWEPDAWDREHRSRVLGGASWIPLAREVLELQREEPTLDLLVSFGGCDPAGLSERCLAALRRSGFRGRTQLVVGPRMEERRAELAALCPPNVELVSGAQGIGARMARSRRVLTALGTTLYELAWLGVPGLVLANYAHDRSALAWYANHGPHLPLGVAPDLDDAELDRRLAQALERTAGERPVPRHDLGQGAARLADLLQGATIHA